jgi:hypothetical protein
VGKNYPVIGIVLLITLLMVTAGAAYIYKPNSSKPTTELPQTAIPAFDHIVVIVEENKPYADIIGNANAPYLNSLAHTYAQAKNYQATTNPSLPNYIALTSGTTAGITTDCSPKDCQADTPTNIADRIEQSGRTWKSYNESMPEPCGLEAAGRYAPKHNPFVYYPSIVNDPVRCKAHVVPFTQFATDLAANQLPSFAFITPDLCSDMHDCPVKTGDTWLANFVPNLLVSPAFTKQNSLLVITWDEGTIATNHIPTLLIGPEVKKQFASKRPYTHYSLLHTIEQSWNVGTLTKNDQNALLMTDFFLATSGPKR